MFFFKFVGTQAAVIFSQFTLISAWIYVGIGTYY